MFLSIFLVIILSFLPSSENCSCKIFGSEKEGYCSSPWISKVKVIAKETDPLGLLMVYKVAHIKIIKNPEHLQLPEVLTTSTQESACGQTGFKLNKEYIFAGSEATNSSLFITTCDWRVPLKYINETSLELLPEYKTKLVDNIGKC
ncbi:unnamed protein product [Caenorhabditis angaria]|uniref:NTR domain-containing protein n=1 Tax=Caenorhabditis angaria TaxID=860376 RepID=A0A9P1IUM8_9PELO|nr:unnamed protein product [Caenorhabditis angaria]